MAGVAKEVNDLLTLTDKGTPMGELFRQYWIPALHTDELPENDCPPVRVELLGEKMIAFRDTKGRYGLIEEFCSHRRVSLWFARNEDCGLRCAYHGWKFDVEGNCVDLPSDNDKEEFKKSVKLTAYSLVKVGDVLWAYMGDPANRPPEPAWEFCTVAPEQTVTTKRLQECNWLQSLEGGIDSNHVSFLHSMELERDPLFRGSKGNKYNLADLSPHFELTRSGGGFHIGARRKVEGNKHYWRVTQYVMPCFTMIPPRGDHPQHGHFWIPVNNESCMTWSYDYHPKRPLTFEERKACLDGKGVHVPIHHDGTFRSIQNKSNNYLIDRAAQKRGETFSGVMGFGMQDASLQESMGPIVDRSRENLVASDKGIALVRNLLRKSATDLTEKGIMPPGREREHMMVRSVSVLLEADQNYVDACKNEMVADASRERVSV